jgi:hypothetical protein
MEKTASPAPFAAKLLILLLFFLGIVAVASGAMLFAAPDGRFLGMTPDSLEGSPFRDYLIPGIILFLAVGVFQFLTAYGLVARSKWRWLGALNPIKSQYWAWTASWAAGVIMIIWIVVETALLGYVSFLQPLIFVWALVLIILAFLPGVRRYYRVK